MREFGRKKEWARNSCISTSLSKEMWDNNQNLYITTHESRKKFFIRQKT